MRRGQSTLEYVLLIGAAVVAFIAMTIYIGRGFQGNLRNQADQLGAGQYEPGKTTINNSEEKIVTSTSKTENSATVRYGNLNEPNKLYDAKMKEVDAKAIEIEELKKSWELAVVDEALAKAKNASAGNSAEAARLARDTAVTDLGKLESAAEDLLSKWPPREKDVTTINPSNNFGESGRVTDTKNIDEKVGSL